ncbi:hypothetical protein ACIQRW_05120 [Streptomyces sp. NPDC091287]|uniref:hypothetical protein n=1 Tax=Streptomyces sp. NPDC091287 TaxID=3365988 RepID=UPI0038309D69
MIGQHVRTQRGQRGDQRDQPFGGLSPVQSTQRVEFRGPLRTGVGEQDEELPGAEPGQ